MPVLKKRADGGYYIRGWVPGVGQFSTWQVTPEGVALLRRIGITDGDEIPRILLRELRDCGRIYTGRSGLGVQPMPTADRPLAPSPDPLPLLFREDEDGWHLQLVLPALPNSFLTRSGTRDGVFDTMDHCILRVDQSQDVSAWVLWPGKGDAACQVAPHEKTYTVEPVGPWPAEWDLAIWTRGAEGVRATGTLFAGAELASVRLSIGEPIVLGQSYYFLTLDDPTRPLSISLPPIPTDLEPRALPPQGRWKAWELYVPSVVGDRVRDWCLRIGHPVGEPPWRLTLVSPPPLRYSASGLPVVEVGHEVIIAAYPPLPAGVGEGIELLAERDRKAITHMRIRPTHSPDPSHPAFKSDDQVGEPLYFAWPITQEGEYRLRAARGRVVPLTFESVAVEPFGDSSNRTVQPKPLEVVIADGSSELRLRAFVDGSGPHEMHLSSRGGNATLVITVQCLAPVEVSWSCESIHGRCQQVHPKEVQHVLAEDLTAGLANGHLFQLRIDAGNFGMLRIYLHPATLTESSTAAPPGMPAVISLSPHTARRARWLAQVIPALLERGEIAATPLPSAMRATLASLDSLLEGCTLGRLTVVPRPLLPHLKALAQALHQPSPRLSASGGTPPTHEAQQSHRTTSKRGQLAGLRRGDTS